MDKQELQKEIENARAHLTNIEKMLEQCEYSRLKPKRHDIFYYLNEYSEVERSDFCDDEVDRYLYETFNCFRTKEQAEQEAEKILVRRMLEDIARRLNKDKTINWRLTTNQVKYYIFLGAGDELSYNGTYINKVQGTIYCLDENFLNVAIQEIGEERLKKYLRGE